MIEQPGIGSVNGIELVSSNGARRFQFPSGNTDALRWAAIVAANAASAATDTVTARVGSARMDSALVWGENRLWDFGKTRLYPVAGGIGNFYYLSFGVIGVSGADNLTIQNLDLDGNSDNTSFGGMFVDKSYNSLIQGVLFRNWPQANGALVVNGNPLTKDPGHKISCCHFESNAVGMYLLGEFWQVSGTSFLNNGIGVSFEPGGNADFTNCQFDGHTVAGLKIKGTLGNDSHGTFTGCRFTHNSGDSICIDAGADNGSFFANCYASYEDDSHGFIRCNAGIKWVGGYISVPIVADTVPTTPCEFINVTMGANAIITGLSAGERAMFKFYNCINEDGTPWVNNDPVPLPSYAKAALPAAVVGGMIYVTDETGGAVPAFYDGTNWRRVTDRAIVS